MRSWRLASNALAFARYITCHVERHHHGACLEVRFILQGYRGRVTNGREASFLRCLPSLPVRTFKASDAPSWWAGISCQFWFVLAP